MPYRLPTIILLSTLILAVAAFSLLLRPRQQSLDKAKKELASLEQRLNTAKWPADANALRQLLEQQNQLLDGDGTQPGALVRNRQAFQQASSLFTARIIPRYQSHAKFLQSVSRIDYQEALAAFQNLLQQDKVAADAASLNLPEDSADTPTYQLLLQLWTVETLWQTCRETGLQPLKGKNGQINMALLAPVPYFDTPTPSQDNQNPYLLEFPVLFSVQGTPEQISALADKLLRPESFLPFRHFTLSTMPRLAQGQLAVQAQLDAICSAFFLPEEPDHDE